MSKRPYKTTAQRKKEGWRSNSLPRGDNVIEPDFPTAHPPKPNYLDSKGSEFWDFICPLLVDAGVVKKTDGDILACVCMTRSRLIEVYELIEKDKEKPSKHLGREDTLQKRFRQELKELGLTPVGRIGIAFGEKKLGGDDL